MKVTLLAFSVSIFSAVVLIAAYVLVFINRDSEKIVGVTFPLLFALLSGLGLAFAYNREPSVVRSFPVEFLASSADGNIQRLTYRHTAAESEFLFGLFRQQQQLKPSVLSGADLQQLYHELLQRSLVEWIAVRHFTHWRTIIERFDTGPEYFGGAPDANDFEVKKLSFDDLKHHFGSNKFSGVHMGFGTLALPHDTELVIKVPSEAQQTGEIYLKNALVNIVITTTPAFSGSGLGQYSQFTGTPQLSQDFWHGQYIVRIKIDYAMLRVGDPLMKHLKTWSLQIANGLQWAFDEQRIYHKTVEEFTLAQHLPKSQSR